MNVRFLQDIAISALGGRFQAGQIVDVDEAQVDMLVNGGYAEVATDELESDDASEPDASLPKPERKTARRR